MSYSIDISQQRESEFYFIKSIYIPRIFENITTEKIKHAFEVLDLGIIGDINLVQRGNLNQNMAFVHFKKWNTNPAAQNLAKKILDPDQQARLIYDDPWYWILLPNNKPVGVQHVKDGETIEGLKQKITEYKMIIDDLESQLFEERVNNIKINDESEHTNTHQMSIRDISPIYSCSSFEVEMSDFDDNDETIPVHSQRFMPELSMMSQQKSHSGILASVSNWHSQSERKILNPVHMEHLHQHTVTPDLELGINSKQSSNHTKVSPIIRAPYLEYEDENEQVQPIWKHNQVNILIEDNIPSETMFDSKGNRYIKQNGRWFKIEDRKIEQHFWCDP